MGALHTPDFKLSAIGDKDCTFVLGFSNNEHVAQNAIDQYVNFGKHSLLTKEFCPSTRSAGRGKRKPKGQKKRGCKK